MIKHKRKMKLIKKILNCNYIRYSPAETSTINTANLDPIALFSNYRLTTSSGKHLEEISHAHTVSLMNKLLMTSSKDT